MRYYRPIRLAWAQLENLVIDLLTVLLGVLTFFAIVLGDKAMECYQKAGAPGLYRLAVEKLSTCTDDKDADRILEETLDMIRESAEQGYARALYYMGHIFEEGEFGQKQDFQLAEKYYIRAAEKGFPEAIMTLGDLYNGDEWLPRNEELRLRYFQQGVDINNGQACRNLARIFLLGEGSIRPNRQLAESYAKKAVELGHPFGKHVLAEVYMYFMPQDIPKALELLHQAIDEGDMQAAAILGEIYISGIKGIPSDMLKAIQYLTKAATGGFALAAQRLGEMHSKGEAGLPKDDRKAFKYFVRASESAAGFDA